MNVEQIREYCKSLPSVTEDVKWGNDLCFLIGKKMFCVTSLAAGDQSISFKVRDEDFEELTAMEGFSPAPYVARYKWVLLTNPGNIPGKQLQDYIKQSYELVKSKLPKKTIKELG